MGLRFDGVGGSVILAGKRVRRPLLKCHWTLFLEGVERF